MGVREKAERCPEVQGTSGTAEQGVIRVKKSIVLGLFGNKETN